MTTLRVFVKRHYYITIVCKTEIQPITINCQLCKTEIQRHEVKQVCVEHKQVWVRNRSIRLIV